MRRVITTSQWTARALAAEGVPIAQLRVAEPGVDRRKTRGSSDPKAKAVPGAPQDLLNLLCVGTLTPRKGHGVLLEALNEIRDRHWHLTCAGSPARRVEHLVRWVDLHRACRNVQRPFVRPGAGVGQRVANEQHALPPLKGRRIIHKACGLQT